MGKIYCAPFMDHLKRKWKRVLLREINKGRCGQLILYGPGEKHMSAWVDLRESEEVKGPLPKQRMIVVEDPTKFRRFYPGEYVVYFNSGGKYWRSVIRGKLIPSMKGNMSRFIIIYNSNIDTMAFVKWEKVEEGAFRIFAEQVG